MLHQHPAEYKKSLFAHIDDKLKIETIVSHESYQGMPFGKVWQSRELPSVYTRAERLQHYVDHYERTPLWLIRS